MSASPSTVLTLGLAAGSGPSELLLEGFGTGSTPTPPVADFSGTPTSGTAPLSVAFTYSGTGGTPDSFSWEKNSGSGWVAFSGSPTDENPTESFALGTWSVRVTATNTGGSDTKTRTNYVTSIIPAPVNTVAPAVTGTAQVGQTLTCSTGTWTNTPTSYTYQWRQDGSDITGATSSTYVPVVGDIGFPLDCVVTAHNAGGSTPQASNATDDVLPAAPVANFSGTPRTGASPLSVVFTDSSTNTPTSWHWEKNSGSGWVDFAGSPTSQNPTESFASGSWSVRLTATNDGGSNTRTKNNYITSGGSGAGAKGTEKLSLGLSVGF